MKVMPIQKREISDSRIVFGCMGLGGDWNYDPYTHEQVTIAEKAIEAALETGITMFDHADIYKMGKAEAVFGEVMKTKPGLREQIVLQSKCGIRFTDGVLPQRYDFSKSHILSSVDGILQRLGTDYLDVLLLHRPDPLMEPDEIAEAFQQLKASGKVRHFGVSNMTAAQMRYLQKSIEQPLVVNQLELHLSRLDWLDQGILVNRAEGSSLNFDDGILQHCLMEDIQLQAWGPLSQGRFTGKSLEGASEPVKATTALIAKMAQERETTPEAILLGWLMKHPAKIQPVIGTSSAERVKACKDAVRQAELMSREDWYALYTSARGVRVP
ncbi:aldo/keto reductase [Paenibacillus hexagrammi]|uniref:Aldo/keto reductase n=1 Tax=Paenibacillus hexagrammi TaxID=2908839 RepID=A0ABY3SFM7_9BACL|nr:aldo/keto reductase [Paenibacillus sp. YPD9-1]UJF32828.1 aldo/keto reductase [Paenibacillus sp. YPD9-1]